MYSKKVKKRDSSKINELREELKRKSIGDIEKRNLLKPDGYAKKIAEEAKLSRVQLRKIFSEFKLIKEKYDKYRQTKDPRIKSDIEIRIYKLYPSLQYQVNREVIKNREFKDLIFQILEDLEKDLEKNIDNAYDFMEALVAYAPAKL